jgi:hypothetical protein
MIRQAAEYYRKVEEEVRPGGPGALGSGECTKKGPEKVSKNLRCRVRRPPVVGSLHWDPTMLDLAETTLHIL